MHFYSSLDGFNKNILGVSWSSSPKHCCTALIVKVYYEHLPDSNTVLPCMLQFNGEVFLANIVDAVS